MSLQIKIGWQHRGRPQTCGTLADAPGRRHPRAICCDQLAVWIINGICYCELHAESQSGQVVWVDTEE